MPADVPDFSTAVTQPAVHQQTFSVPADGLQHSVTVTPPSGTHALAFACPDASGNVQLDLVEGATSGNFFQGGLGQGIVSFLGQLALVPVVLDATYEPSFTVTFRNLGSLAQNVDIFAVLDAEAVAVWASQQGQQTVARSISVVLASNSPNLPIPITAPRAWDQVGTSSPATGSAPSITIPAPGAGLHNQLDHLSLTLGMVAPGAAFNGSLRVRDASSSGTILWQEAIAMAATAGGLLNIERADMRLRQPNANTALWIGVDTVSADAGGGLNAGCYSVS